MMVETLCERTSFSSKNDSLNVSASVLTVNLRRLQLEKEKGTTSVSFSKECMETRDLFHSIAGLYSASLPDMELEAIYSTLTKPSQTIVVIATKQDVIEHRRKVGAPPKIEFSTRQEVSASNEGEEFTEDPYCKVFSDSEDEDEAVLVEEDDGSIATGQKETFEQEKLEFLEGVKSRRSLDPNNPDSVGIDDRLMGCITFLKLSSKPGESVSQILLLAVRHRWRRLGIGGYLTRLSKDPSIIGHYDMLLTYADHKAESFFIAHGFTDDPIITARHKRQADYWENSTLMAYIPPYSVQNCSSSLKSVDLLEEQLKKWRVLSMAAHCDQVCVMERLKQEILTLISRVDSQQEVIDTLHKELRGSQRSYRSLEVEYEMYRVQTQAKLVRLMEERARGWISSTEEEVIAKSSSNSSKVNVPPGQV